MKSFFSKYSYSMVKLFITQVALGLFGGVLALATSTNDILLWVAGIGSVLFYLFLIYVAVWEIGAKDRISIDLGKAKKRPYVGFLITLIANVPNIIVASIYAICWFISKGAEGAATNIAAFMRVITLFIEGMYYGLMTAIGIGPNSFWWAYFVIVLPAVLVGGVAYILGTMNAHLTKMMEPLYPESDREPKKKFFAKKKDE